MHSLLERLPAIGDRDGDNEKETERSRETREPTDDTPFAAPVPAAAVRDARERTGYDGETSLVRLLDALHRWTQRNRDSVERWLVAAVAADSTLVTPVYVDGETVTIVFPAERWRELKPTLNVTDEQLAAMLTAHRAVADCWQLGAAASVAALLTVELRADAAADVLAAANHEETIVASAPDPTATRETDRTPTAGPPATIGEERDESLEDLLARGPFGHDGTDS